MHDSDPSQSFERQPTPDHSDHRARPPTFSPVHFPCLFGPQLRCCFHESLDHFRIDVIEALASKVPTELAASFEQAIGVIKGRTLSERKLHVCLVRKHATELAFLLVWLQCV